MRKRASLQGAWLSPCGQAQPPATETTPRRHAWPLRAPDLAPLSDLGQKPQIIQNKARQGHHSNSRPKKATGAPTKGRLAPLSAMGQLQGPLVSHGDNDAQKRPLKGHGMLCSKNANKCNTNTRSCCLLIIVPLPLNAGRATHTNKGRGSRLLPQQTREVREGSALGSSQTRDVSVTIIITRVLSR